jgi:S-adenosylmethionine synthetase
MALLKSRKKPERAMSHKTIENLHFAEYVSPGHPDRLADAIAEHVIDHGLNMGHRNLIGIEVAVHDNQVFIDGRFTYPATITDSKESIRGKFDEWIRGKYSKAGYGRMWSPHPDDLEITNVTCIEPLLNGESEIRSYSDDQNLVIGYAEPSPGTNYLPPVHFLANRIGRALWDWRHQHDETYGPDFKVLPFLQRTGLGKKSTWQWKRLTLSLQHKDQAFCEQQHSDLLPFLENTLSKLEESTGLRGVSSTFELRHLHLNGAGNFCQGGPEGDNGLSGKKLVVDHYGPDIPIGGGAICGKDPHKVDKVGPLRARQLAKQLTRQHEQPARVRIGWSPGDEAPFFIEAALEDSGTWKPLPAQQLPPRDWFNIDTIFNDLQLGDQTWSKIVLDGYFMDASLPWEL